MKADTPLLLYVLAMQRACFKTRLAKTTLTGVGSRDTLSLTKRTTVATCPFYTRQVFRTLAGEVELSGESISKH
jgi:hypothetical protein